MNWSTPNVTTVEISPEILRIVAEIDAFASGWQSTSILLPERLSALRRVATIESIGSSTRIEGSKLSDNEVEQLLSQLEEGTFQNRDEQEVAGYADVMETVFTNWQNLPLSENYIQQLHAMLLRHSSKDEHHRGRYKILSNNVEAFDADGQSLGVVFATATPFETPALMASLVAWTEATLEDQALHPLLVIGMFKASFLAIHPFQDGNGRLSRVLTTLLLLKAGYDYVPYSSLESIIERSKEDYYLALRRTQTSLRQDRTDWSPWLHYFMRALKAQKVHLAHKLAQNTTSLEFPYDSLQILAHLQDHPHIAMQEAETLTGTPRATLKLRFNNLIKTGLVVRHGKGRGVRYVLSRSKV